MRDGFTFMIHDLLSDGVTRCLQHLLNSPKKNYVVTTQLKTNEKRSFSVMYMVIKNTPPSLLQQARMGYLLVMITRRLRVK